ncbi:MAG: CDP-diacylglycerol--serine O-phosphatidyltransferase, partial [Pseudorhodoplanes sp.]|nr:CDP-diacylglycerol--serine O-phosphatidyltransferase [Pseudorhodoplanes sp.]
LILYVWGLNELRGAGWIACLVFAICMCLRLARFNVMAEDPNKPIWAGNFFTGVPAPAGAIIVMLPIYLNLLGTPKMSFLGFLYVLFVSFLLVSTLPVFSGKRIGKRVPPEMVLPIFVAIVLFVALLVSYPWEVLTVGTVLYLGALPLGWFSYQKYRRKDAEATAAAAPPTSPGATTETAATAVAPKLHTDGGERPERLN